MTRVRVYGVPASTWTRTVCMTCVEKGIDYDLVRIAYGSPEHRALHPFGRIPIVEIDGETLFETLAVTGRLDEGFPGPSLQAGDAAGRARMRIWMSLCSDYIFRDVVRAIPRRRAATEAELGGARAALEQADALVGPGPFLAGEALTLADLYLAPQVSNCLEKAPELLRGCDALTGWFDLVRARESFARTSYDPAGV